MCFHRLERVPPIVFRAKFEQSLTKGVSIEKNSAASRRETRADSPNQLREFSNSDRVDPTRDKYTSASETSGESPGADIYAPKIVTEVTSANFAPRLVGFDLFRRFVADGHPDRMCVCQPRWIGERNSHRSRSEGFVGDFQPPRDPRRVGRDARKRARIF